MYDVLIVGAGLFGATCARELADRGRKILVVEKESEPGGMCRDEWQGSILVHKHGPHIFHTNNSEVWRYAQRFADFRHYNQFDIASWNGGLYSFPVNLLTMYQVFGIETLAQAETFFRELPQTGKDDNLEECAVNRFGETLYEMFIRDYTIKQWGRQPCQLPASIIKRVPVRLSFDARYHDTLYQGIPENGYSAMIGKMLEGVDVEYGVDFNKCRNLYDAKDIIYSGSPDELQDCDHGALNYRTLDFKHEILDGDYQGTSVIRYTGADYPYTRVIEHKYFDTRYKTTDKTVVTWETPREWQPGDERYYPIQDERNEEMAGYYKSKARNQGYIIGGRLGSYRYMNMDQVIAQALRLVRDLDA